MADETKKKLTQAQQLEAAKAQAEAAETALAAKSEETEAAASEIESLKSDIASIKESIESLTQAVADLKSEKEEDPESEEDEDKGEDSEAETEAEDKPESKEDYDEETKSVLTLCSMAIQGLMEDNATLKSLEQNIQKRASAKLTSMCAELGISPAMKTGAAADNSANAGESPVVTRAEFDRMNPKQKNQHLRAGGKIKD